MGKKEEGFDSPVIRDLTVENTNESINKMSEMINLLLTEVRRLKDNTQSND